jgi:hypothetical protein
VAAVTAREALQEIALSALEDEAIEGLRDLIPMLLEIAGRSDGKNAHLSVRAAKEVKDILLALEKLDRKQEEGGPKVPMVVVQMQGKASATVTSPDGEVLEIESE